LMEGSKVLCQRREAFELINPPVAKEGFAHGLGPGWIFFT
jgi:hypothetical protein